MRVRVDGEVDAKMDNGVRINPYFRGRARQESAEEAEAKTGAGGPRCHAGHGMLRRNVGASGLTCGGGCGRALKRGAVWWSCEACDFDVCDACGGNAEG